MSGGLTAVLVVLLMIAGCAYIARMASRDKREERLDGREQDRLERRNDLLEDEVEQLRERVKVLERIATDPARRTADEIEKLRGPQD